MFYFTLFSNLTVCSNNELIRLSFTYIILFSLCFSYVFDNLFFFPFQIIFHISQRTILAEQTDTLYSFGFPDPINSIASDDIDM